MNAVINIGLKNRTIPVSKMLDEYLFKTIELTNKIKAKNRKKNPLENFI